MSRRWVQKKPGSNSYVPVQKGISWQRPFSDPVYDAPAPKQTPLLQAKRPSFDWSRVTIEPAKQTINKVINMQQGGAVQTKHALDRK